MKWKSFCLAAALLMTGLARADEGMWPYSKPPLAELKQRYGFEPSPAWLDHLMKSSVRFNSGGSGSFVSADGLVMTNHHVAAESIQKLSGPGKDLLRSGYIAHNRAEELRCHDLELNVLQSIQDVTERIQSAIPAGADAAAAEKARRAAINTLEEEERQKTGLRCDVVTLYRGGLYHLYRYKRYTDVRLVFAPEIDVAFFGGDTDNFEYPRYCLDVSFFRVYENGKPLHPKDYLKWSTRGVKEGDLILVSGHPGRTDRLNTVSHLEFMRDVQYPEVLNFLRRLEVMLNTYAERSAENARQAQDERFGVQNSRKARGGGLEGLQDPELLAAKRKAEQELRQRVESDPQLRERFGSAWTQVDGAIARLRELYPRYVALERARGFNSELFTLARTLVRLAEENQKPNAERLREFSQSNRQSLEQHLFSTAPLYPAFETRKLANSLGFLVEQLGAEDPLVQQVLAGQSPVERAQQLVRDTHLADVGYRKRLASLSPAELQASPDPMIQLALMVDPESRRLRTEYEKSVSEPLEQAYEKIAQASFLAQPNLYPDATFTLRLAYGKVAGTAHLPYTTRLRGLFTREAEHGAQPPFRLPQRWEAAKSRLNLDTPLDFICTADIIGGNSGSPVVNRAGEVVGLIFDGNLASLVLDFGYSEDEARALAVDVRAIVEALTKVYAVPALAAELKRS